MRNRNPFLVFSLAFALYPATSRAESYQENLEKIGATAKALVEQIDKAKDGVVALEKSGAVDATEFRGRLTALETEVKAVKAAHVLTSRKLQRLGELTQTLAEINVKISNRLAAVEKTVAEHGKRLDSHDVALKKQSAKLNHVWSVVASTAFTGEAIGFGGSKDGTGMGGAIGLSVGLLSGRTVLLRAGATSSSVGGSFAALSIVTLQFPVDDDLQVGAGAYFLGNFSRAKNKGYDAQRLGVGAMIGPTFVRGCFTASLYGGFGYSVEVGGKSEEGTAWLGFGTMGLRL